MGKTLPRKGAAAMARCFIFSAGTFYGLREVPGPGDLVIAADAGLLHCQALGITPGLIVGDFDSMDAPEGDIPTLRLPVEKDDTDSMQSIKEGLARGFREFYLYGGTGGARLDHTLANLQSLVWLARHGACGWLYDRDFVYTAVENGTLSIPRTVEWGLLSMFAMTDTAEGVTLTGVQYPLEQGTVTCEFPIGVSNHILEPTATVSVERGTLLVGWQLPGLE